MELDSIGEVIAERVLKRSVNGGEPQDVVVRLGKPQPFPDGSGYFSPFEIIGIGERKIRYAAGVDAFQSLQLVLRMISVTLHYWKNEPSSTMFMDEPGDDLGFPEEAF
jgi:hypothetical protein